MKELLKNLWKQKMFQFLLLLQVTLSIVYFFMTSVSIQEAFNLFVEVPKVLKKTQDTIMHLETQEDTNVEDFQKLCNALRKEQVLEDLAFYEERYFNRVDNFGEETEIGNLKMELGISEMGNFATEQGRGFKKEDLKSDMPVMLLGSKVAQKYHLKAGDLMEVSDIEHKIVGILKEDSHWFFQTISEGNILSLDNQVVTLVPSFEEEVPMHFYGIIGYGLNPAMAVDKVQAMAERYHVILKAEMVNEELNEQYQKILNDNIQWLVFSISIMIMVAIGTASLSVARLYTRKKEMGIRMAVGYSTRRLFTLYMGEIVVLMFLSYAIACFFGNWFIGDGTSILGGLEMYTGHCFTGNIAFLGGIAVLCMCLPPAVSLFMVICKFQPKNLIGGKE